MRQFSDLPEGNWLVKWLDLFSSSAAAGAQTLTVWLERSPFGGIASLERLRGEAVSDYLARVGSHRGLAQPRQVITRRILAGNIPDVIVGDVHSTGGMQGKLHRNAVRLRLDCDTPMREVTCGEQIEPPYPGWGSYVPFQVVNPFEYASGHLGMQPSRCLLVAQDGIDYIVPKLAIFRAFYCCCTQLTNAVLRGPWGTTLKRVCIATDKPMKSGLRTGINEDGTWNIVLAAGIGLAMAYPIALLVLDPYAKAQAEAIYSKTIEQSLSGQDVKWYIDAGIPFDITATPIDMTVEGYFLRPWNRQGHRRRFLVTTVTGATWPQSFPELRAEIQNSGERGEKPNVDVRDRPYVRGGKAPVAGRGDAQSEHGGGSDPRESTNVFHQRPFEYDNLPEIVKQMKKTSDTYPIAPVRKKVTEPAKRVSSGSSAGSGQSAAPAELIVFVRERSRQFDFLLAALERARLQGVIDRWKPVGPPAAIAMDIKRGDVECWSLVEPQQRREPPPPPKRRAWHWVYSGAKPGLMERGAYPRCMLVVEVDADDRSLTFFEIECRPKESFSMLVLEGSVRSMSADSAEILTSVLRSSSGRPEPEQLVDAVPALYGRRLFSRRHAFEYVESQCKRVAIGLKEVFVENLVKGTGETDKEDRKES